MVKVAQSMGLGRDFNNDSLNQNISHSRKNLLTVKWEEIV